MATFKNLEKGSVIFELVRETKADNQIHIVITLPKIKMISH